MLGHEIPCPLCKHPINVYLGIMPKKEMIDSIGTDALLLLVMEKKLGDKATRDEGTVLDDQISEHLFWDMRDPGLFCYYLGFVPTRIMPIQPVQPLCGAQRAQKLYHLGNPRSFQ